jgi:archaellum biogenesis protein FlaJ (TadC family)
LSKDKTECFVYIDILLEQKKNSVSDKFAFILFHFFAIGRGKINRGVFLAPPAHVSDDIVD